MTKCLGGNNFYDVLKIEQNETGNELLNMFIDALAEKVSVGVSLTFSIPKMLAHLKSFPAYEFCNLSVSKVTTSLFACTRPREYVGRGDQVLQ